MGLIEVVSTNVRAVGYDTETRVMRVEFKSGGVYDYWDVASALFDQMREPYPWRRVGREVLAHPCQRVR